MKKGKELAVSNYDGNSNEENDSNVDKKKETTFPAVRFSSRNNSSKYDFVKVFFSTPSLIFRFPVTIILRIHSFKVFYFYFGK